MAVVKGKAMWASVISPNTTFTPQYCIDLIIDKDTALSLREKGLKVKNDEELGYIFKAKRNVMKADGVTPNSKPNVVGPDGKTPFTELVGNGSIVNLQYSTYEWSNKFGKGVGVDLVGVQVVEHVPFSGTENEFTPVEQPEAASGANEFDDEEDSPFK